MKNRMVRIFEGMAGDNENDNDNIHRLRPRTASKYAEVVIREP